MTATRASGPYSASDSSNAASTVAAGSTKHEVRTEAGTPSLTSLTFTLRRTFFCRLKYKLYSACQVFFHGR